MRKYVLCILGALLSLPAAWPQTSSSTVRGTITDQHQAVIPRAAVTLTNTATNVARSTLTNESGVYVSPASSRDRTESRLNSRNAEVRGNSDRPGAAGRDGGRGPASRPDRHAGGCSRRHADGDRPPTRRWATRWSGSASSNFRSTAGTTRRFSPPCRASTRTGIVQAYGMRTNTSTTLFDGAPVNEVWEGWDFGRVPGLDALEEMHVETNNSSAKFARPVTVLLGSKSGTNQFHGALVRNHPKQRNRRRAPQAGHVHQGAVSEPQRVRAVRGRSCVHSEGLQRAQPHVLLRLLGRAATAGIHDEPIQRADRGHAERRFQRPRATARTG